MTDDELKTLVASLAVAQQVTSEEIKALAVATSEEINALAAAQKETGEQIKRNDKMLTQKLDRLTEKLERMGITLGSIGQNQGDVAEEFFFHSLIKDNRLGGIYFDDVTKTMGRHKGKVQEEYDLVLSNCDAVAVIEVKYKAHENDLDKLDRKMKHFKILFPAYQAFKQYGAIAAFHINEDAKAEALRRGYFVLQRSGDMVHTESGDSLTVL